MPIGWNRFRPICGVHRDDSQCPVHVDSGRRWATVDWGRVSYLYGSDEVFYRFSDGEFWRNRFQAGCNLLFNKHADLKLYYQRQDSHDQTPGAINALGLLAVVTF